VDSAGNVYFLDSTHLIKKVSASNQTVSAIVGPASAFYAGSPIQLNSTDLAMTVDSNDNLYVVYTDSLGDYAVAKISPAGQTTAITSVASLLYTESIQVDAAGDIYAGNGNTIHKYAPDGTLLTISGSYTGIDILQDGPASAAVEGAVAMGLGPDGNLYFADQWYDRIRRITVGGCATVHQPVIGAVLNGASFGGNALSPAETVSLFGLSLGPATAVLGQFDSSGTLTNSLAGVSVLFGGQPAPLFYAADGQINAQVPLSTMSDLYLDVRVIYSGLASDALTQSVHAVSPGIFGATGSSGRVASVVNANGTINSASNPAVRGTYVSLYATGGGLTSPQVADGVPAPGIASLLLPATVSVNNVMAQVYYAGTAPTFVGLVQVNFLVPDATGVVSGYNPVVLTVGGASNSDTSGFYVK
jgi:uncharacterized protein (TIGR03437 family)